VGRSVDLEKSSCGKLRQIKNIGAVLDNENYLGWHHEKK
jgi:hypothetical protein